ncbi:MAG: hypothetical protein EPO02_13515 [Nitrospirae bacterium]|nr:MAG: hypothetical protein EPO02_13515 [Nitrospirota bacterium]
MKGNKVNQPQRKERFNEAFSRVIKDSVQILDRGSFARQSGSICDHNETHSEEFDFGRLKGYPSYDWDDDWQWVEVCDKCNAWQDQEGFWHND